MVFCRINLKYMKSGKNVFLKKWITGNLAVYPGALGILHPVIAHGLTGDHDRILTTQQFIMHTLSLFVFILFLVRMQNKTFQIIGKRQSFTGIWPFLFFSPWVFWLGYYTFFVPFDILFMFLSIGVINAVQLRSMVKYPNKWIWQCILVYFFAAIVGIVIGLGAYLHYYKDLQGIARDLATWISISTPAALILAYLLRYVLSSQISIPENHASGIARKQEMQQEEIAVQ